MKRNIILYIIFLFFASGIKAQNNITDTPSNEGVNVCIKYFKNVGYNNFTFHNTEQNTKYYSAKNKIDNSEFQIMKKQMKAQIIKQCFGLFISGKTKRAYFIGIMRNPYKPIKECITQKAEHLMLS